MPMMVPRLALAPTPGTARGAARGAITGPPEVLPTAGVSGFMGAHKALDPPTAGLRPLLPPAGGLGTPTPLAGLPLQAGAGPGIGLGGGTPNLGTARALPGASLALPCAGPSHRSREPWALGRLAASTLPARAFRLDVALATEWSARLPALASSSPRGRAAAAARVKPPPWGAARAGLLFCSRLDLRTGGAGGAAPPGLVKRLPLGATLRLLLGAAFGLPRQAAAAARESLQDVAGVVTPSVVAPLRSGGIWATASGLWAAPAATSQPSTTLRALASTGAGLGALPAEGPW